MIYPAIISKSEGSYVVEFPGLDGCLTEGETIEAAFLNAEEALNGWLASNYDRNLSVLEPAECFSLASPTKNEIVVKVSVNPVIALAYQMRFSRKNDGNKSLQELADLMKVSQQNYSKVFENPKANPTLETIAKGLDELGYFLELNILPKGEAFGVKKLKADIRPKVKIQNFEIPESKKKRA